MRIKDSKGKEHLAWYLILNPSEPQKEHIYANTKGAFDDDDKEFKKKKVLDAAMQNANLRFVGAASSVKALSLTGISKAGGLRSAMNADVSSRHFDFFS